jgi:hypothetical protein
MSNGIIDMLQENNRIATLFSQLLAEIVKAGIEGTTDGQCVMAPAAFKADDAAKYLGIGRTKLLEYRSAGLLKTVDIGGGPKYLRKDLDRLINKLEKG